MDRPDRLGPPCAATVSVTAPPAAPVTVRVTGDLGPRGLVALDVALKDAVLDGALVVEVDLDDVSFTKGAVLATLVAARRRCRRSGVALTVHCVDPAMSRLLTITGLDGSLRRPAVVAPAVTGSAAT